MSETKRGVNTESTTTDGSPGLMLLNEENKVKAVLYPDRRPRRKNTCTCEPLRYGLQPNSSGN